ncbi:transposase family protein [Rhodococcus sp. D-6]|uniref:Transposase n=2 Tax=Rhodococcus TaxID=1827 RepID=V9XM74_9NOCA|nr:MULTISPECIES: transposase family protein [Rhodococcus]AHD23144.1 transposase [Rhodococcus pyridinivorans SB3094]MCT7294332.1 transposase [Rhodococcus sp. PAE-6]
MITYSATLDVPRPLAQHLAALLQVNRLERGSRRGRRALTPFHHAVLVLRWFRQDTPLATLARDAGISIATGYRYLHEGIDVLAAQAPELADVLRHRLATGRTHVILDGTLIPTDRVRETTTGKHGTPIHLWYSGKHRRFGANIQFLASEDGFPLWVSSSLPGSTHDLTAARVHGITGALYAAASQGLPTLADQGYQGVGIGIHTPTKMPTDGNTLDADTACRNALLTRLGCLGERAAALLTTRWKALDRITLCPNRIGDIVKAALVLTQVEHSGRY